MFERIVSGLSGQSRWCYSLLPRLAVFGASRKGLASQHRSQLSDSNVDAVAHALHLHTQLSHRQNGYGTV